MTRRLELNVRLAIAGLTVSTLIWSCLLSSMASLHSAGYTLSIYTQVDVPYWIGLCTGTFLAVLSLWLSVTSSKRPTILTVLALLLVVGFMGLVEFLPESAGYLTLSRGDVLAHATTTTTIIVGGQIPPSDFYPAVHILAATSFFVLGLGLDQVFTLLPVVMVLVFSSFLYLIARRLTNSNLVASTAFLLGALPIRGGYEVALHPSSVSLTLVPLFFWLYIEGIRTPSFSRSLALSLTVIGIVLIHPLTAGFLLGGLVILYLFGALRRIRRLSFCVSAASLARPRVVLLLGVVTVSWLMGFAVWTSNVRLLDLWLKGELETPLEVIRSASLRGGLSAGDLISLGIRLFAPTIILLAVAVIWLLGPSRSGFSRESARRECTVFVSLGIFLGLSWVVTLAGPLALDPFRSLTYLTVPVMIVASLPIGFVLLDRKPMRVIAALACIGLLLGSAVPTVYTSPYILQPNYQVTPEEVSAAAWFVGKSPGSQTLISIWPFNGQISLVAATLGADSSGYVFGISPDHLGYGAATHGPGQLYPRGTIVVVTSFDIATTTDLWTATGRYTSSDYAYLAADPGLAKVFSNRGVSFWVVTGGP